MEVWKSISGYEGLYEVSNHGRVRSVERTVSNGPCKSKLLKSVILKVTYFTNGYARFFLSKNGTPKQYLAHRLVANAFVENPSNKPFVNHINEKKHDNMASNLEWVTSSENIRHGTCQERIKANSDNSGIRNSMYGRKGSLNPGSKPVLQYSLDGGFIKEYSCSYEAARELKCNPSGITGVCKGRCKTAYGYVWKYKLNN